MKRLIRFSKTIARVVLALALLAGMGGGGYYAILAMASLQKEVLAALLAAFGVTAAALLSKRAEGRHAVEAQFRREKSELYMQFLREFHEISDKDPKETVQFLQEMKHKILFWGSPEIVSRFFELTSVAAQFRPGTLGDLGKTMTALGNLILAMRKDLGLSNRSLSNTSLAVHANLQQPDLFLRCLEGSPEMADEEYRQLEQAANERAIDR